MDKKRLYVHDVAMGKLGRDFTSVKIDENDQMMYVGTMSGDVVKVRLNCHENPDVIDREKSPVLLGCYGRHNPRKPPGKDCEKYNNGVRDLLLLAPGYLLIGAGDGQIELVEERNCNFKNYKNPTWPQFKTVRLSFVSFQHQLTLICLKDSSHSCFWSNFQSTVDVTRYGFGGYSIMRNLFPVFERF